MSDSRSLVILEFAVAISEMGSRDQGNSVPQHTHLPVASGKCYPYSEDNQKEGVLKVEQEPKDAKSLYRACKSTNTDVCGGRVRSTS